MDGLTALRAVRYPPRPLGRGFSRKTGKQPSTEVEGFIVRRSKHG